MKRLILLTYLFMSFVVFGQYCPYLGPDQNLPCGVGSTTLTADLSQCGPGGVGPKQTTNYAVSSIAYNPQTNTGTQLFMGDDTQQGPFPIGFTFCFYGQTYTQFYIGSNGWISFSGGQPTTFTSQPIPTGNVLVPKNCIMGPWQDWHPGLGGQIRYQTSGVAPCRKLTVSWIGIPMFLCTGNQGTFHIVIYESTNVIENYIQDKPACVQWQGGTATEGIHNAAGTLAVTVAGRNSTAWTATNDAWRWTPSGPTVNPVLTWFQVGNPVAIGTGPTITVTPPPGGANYTCQFVYPICNAGWTNCNATAGPGPDTVFVNPGPPNLSPPIINLVNPTCENDCDGVIDVIPVGGSGVQTISWNGQPPAFTLNNLCEGAYSFTILDANGCTVSGVANLIDPIPPVIDPIFGTSILCYNSTVNPFTVSSPIPNLTYTWATTNGTITSGQGTDIINLDITNVAGGNYPNMLSVYGTTILGCLSQIEYYTVDVLRIFPTIDPMGPYCTYDECVTIMANPVGGTLFGNNVLGTTYCPNNGFEGQDTVSYSYTQSGCVFDTSIYVQVYPRPVISEIIPNTNFFEICEGDSVLSTYSITSSLPGGYNEWTLLNNTTVSTNYDAVWNQTGYFNLSVVNWVNGCVSLPQSSLINVALCPQSLIYIPNSFTPDGNEHNQTWQPVFTAGFNPYDYHAMVFNRWGEIIWESYDANSYWDGSYKGGEFYCPEGIYIFKIDYGSNEDATRNQLHGHVTLIR
jgi:gliding motility-associated-like protein